MTERERPPSPPVPGAEPAVPPPAGTPVGSPRIPTKRKLKKKGKKKTKGKGKKKVVKKKGKKLTGKGKKGKRTKATTRKPATSAPQKTSPHPEHAQLVGASIKKQEVAPVLPFGLPIGISGQTNKDAVGSLQFVLYPGMMDHQGPQPNDEGRYLLERRIEALNQLEATKAAAGKTDAVTQPASGSAPSSPSLLAKGTVSPPGAVLRKGSLQSFATVSSRVVNERISPSPRRIPSGTSQKRPPRPQPKSVPGGPTEQQVMPTDKGGSESPALSKSAAIAVVRKPVVPSAELDLIRKKSLGRLWSLRQPPQLPPGLLSKISLPSLLERARTLPAHLVKKTPTMPANTKEC